MRIYFQLTFCAGSARAYLLFVLTHTVTHTRKRTEMAGYLRGGGSSRFVLAGLLSHDLVHEISHLFCGLLLLLAGSVGVGSQGKTSIVVAQHTAYSFYVYTIL